jgi:two-component system, chemotaxis family, CheB/CheR fusion protein
MEVEMETQRGEYYIVRVIPYTINSEVNSGFIITFNEITKLRLIQESLSQSERQHKIAASLTKIGYWDIDIESLKTTWTDEVYNIHEIPIGSSHDVKNGIEYYHPDDRPILQKAIQDCIEKGVEFDLELRFITAANNKKWVRSISRAEMKNNKVVGVYGAIQDITERKNVEHKYRMLFENMNASFALHEMIYDENGNSVDYRFLEVNPMFEKETGLNAKDVIGRTAKELLPNTEQYWIDTFGNVALSGESTSYQNYSSELDQ